MPWNFTKWRVETTHGEGIGGVSICMKIMPPVLIPSWRVEIITVVVSRINQSLEIRHGRGYAAMMFAMLGAYRSRRMPSFMDFLMVSVLVAEN